MQDLNAINVNQLFNIEKLQLFKLKKYYNVAGAYVFKEHIFVSEQDWHTSINSGNLKGFIYLFSG